jgi:hypothetical protein
MPFLHLAIFGAGGVCGFLVGNKNYRRRVGLMVEIFGVWLRNTAEPKHGKSPSWRVPIEDSKDCNEHKEA